MSAKTAIAMRFDGSTLDSQGFPPSSSWELAVPHYFNTDWQGRNADSKRATEVRLLWTPENLYLRFDARYRTITVFADAEPSGRRDHLWDRDVCEAFLQPDASEPRRYKEFEVAPNGFWIDLDIAPGPQHDLKSGLRCRAEVDDVHKQWRGELVLPMKSLTKQFDPSAQWRANFYRVEGAEEPRFYSAWQPTYSAQ